MMVCIMPSQSIMQFSYVCEGRGATATTYSYTKEPRLQETGYETGLKSGSFNYLENGDMKIEENIDYFYGNGTNISNSSVDHRLDVNFTGDRGISEFFGRGFFGNNRWASAWKKIRYEESPTMKVNGWPMVARPSNSIDVHASVFMDTTANRSGYDFNYNAKIKNGVIETKDATGWSNRTGSRKIDWEHETRTSGDELDITNKLFDSWGLKTRLGPEGDWLPCCYAGTIPAIDQLNTKWPSDVMIATLQANTKYPNATLTSKQIIPTQLASVALATTGFGNIYAKKALRIGKIVSPPELQVVAPVSVARSNDFYYVRKNLKIGMVASFPDMAVRTPSANNTTSIHMTTPPILEPSSCNSGACDGYNCIYTYDQDSAGATSTTVALQKGDIRNINVILYVHEFSDNIMIEFGLDGSKAAKEEKYLINVTNNGDVPLSEVQIEAVLPKGMKFATSNYYGSGSGRLTPPILNLKDFDETQKTIVTWDIGSLQPEELKSILFKAYIKKEDKHGDPLSVNNIDVSAKATGNAPGNVLVRSAVDRAIPKKCEMRGLKGRICEGPFKKKCEQNLYCEDWFNQTI